MFHMINNRRVIKDACKIEKYLITNKGCHFKLLKKEELECLQEVNKLDLDFFFECDPAANGLEEIKLTYPGYKAILFHRIAHILYKKGQKIEARIISEYAHSITGIDINPGASIGSPFFIDHGTGVVIGETSVIGNRVRLYQGVTLGALSPKQGQKIKNVKRHPTIKDDVIIYANTTILGDITIGENTVIGGGVYISEDIPSNSKVSLPKPILNIVKK